MSDYLRVGFIFVHLIVFALAIVLLIQSDYSGFFTKPNVEEVRSMGDKMSLYLVMLWCTGIGVVYVDTQFNLEKISHAPKLLTKLACVGVLTLNALFLHTAVFKKMAKAQLSLSDMYVMVMSGAVSTSSWFYAGFLGVAKPLVKHLSFVNFISLYGVLVGVGLIVASFITPIIQKNWNAP